jgi:hypothetical protein
MPVPPGAIAERRLIDRLMRARAFSAANAQPLSDLRWIEQRRLQRLVRVGVIREETPGRYYLDGPALADRLLSRRRRVAIAVTAVLLIMMALFVLMMQTVAY